MQYESYSPGFRLTRGKQSVCEKGLNYPRATLNLGLNKAKVGVGPLCPMLRELTAVYNYVLHTTQCFLGVRVVRLFMHLQASLHSSQMEQGTECYGILKGFQVYCSSDCTPSLRSFRQKHLQNSCRYENTFQCIVGTSLIQNTMGCHSWYPLFKNHK